MLPPEMLLKLVQSRSPHCVTARYDTGVSHRIPVNRDRVPPEIRSPAEGWWVAASIETSNLGALKIRALNGGATEDPAYGQ